MLEQTRVDGGGQAASARLNEEINQWATSSHISPPGPEHCALLCTNHLLSTGDWGHMMAGAAHCTLHTDIQQIFFQDFSRCKDFKIGLFRSRFIKIFQDFSRYTDTVFWKLHASLQ